ncbi:MAG: alpha/beta hydrolase [Pseudomonadota bacterium]
MDVTTQIHFRQCGNPSGPAILYLHAVGTSRWMWDDQCELMPDYCCLVPDLPGHGANKEIAWRSAGHAADLIHDSILRDGRYAEVHLVGVSLGAYVGLELLSRYGEQFSSAVFSGLNVLPIRGRAVLTAVSTLSAPLLKFGPLARVNARMLNIPGEKLDGYCNSARQTSLAAFRRASAEALSYRLPDNAGDIDVPTLILAGENEHALIHTSQRVLVKTLPNAAAGIARGGGHAWGLETPALFADVVRSWTERGIVDRSVKALEAWTARSNAA